MSMFCLSGWLWDQAAMAMSLSADDEDYDSDTAEQVSSLSLSPHTHKQLAAFSGSLPRSTMPFKQGMCFLHLLLLSSPSSPAFFLLRCFWVFEFCFFAAVVIRLERFPCDRKENTDTTEKSGITTEPLSYCLSPLSFSYQLWLVWHMHASFRKTCFKEKNMFLLLYLCVWMRFILVCLICFVGRTKML